jgi:hypothetical protein
MLLASPVFDREDGALAQWDDDFLNRNAQPLKPSTQKRQAEDPEEQARLAARAYFRAAPPYSIRFEEDGRVSLRRKRYKFWGQPDPAAATHWDVISHRPDLEDAEQRLRHITTPPVYYDKRGRVTHAPAEPVEDWGMPDDDE